MSSKKTLKIFISSLHRLPWRLLLLLLAAGDTTFLIESQKNQNFRYRVTPSMISILAQERLLGFTLGSALSGFFVFEQRKVLHDFVSYLKYQSMDQSQMITDYGFEGSGDGAKEPPIIHRDIKSSNILLTENFRAKVADFGFTRLAPDTESGTTHVSTQVK